MKSAFLFPGQGSQYVGMLNDLPNDPVVKHILEESSDLLHLPIESLHNNKALSTTKAVQQCLLIASVSTYKVFEKNGLIPSFVAGILLVLLVQQLQQGCLPLRKHLN